MSQNGLHFEAQPTISREIYLRIFQHNGMFYAISRLGQLLCASGPLQEFKVGGNPFEGTRFSNSVRHIGLLKEGDVLHVFFSAIGDAPESILYTTINLTGDWTAWKIGEIQQVLTPEASYECPDLPDEPSAIGAIDHPVRQVRDPAVFEEDGKIYLFYTFCGEQGVAGAEVKILK